MAGVSIPASAATSFSPSRCLSTAWPKIAWQKERRREGQKKNDGREDVEGWGERGEVGEERCGSTYCISEHIAMHP